MEEVKMKEKMKVMVLICLLVLDVMLCGMSVAARADDQQEMPFGPRFHRGRGGPNLLANFVQENLVVQTLAEITKQPAATIQKQLEEKQMPALFDQYKISPEAFHSAMRTKVTALVNQLVETGYISKEQGTIVLDKMDKLAQRRVLMKKLIDKGIKDGTLTQEQANLLLPRPPQ